MDNTNEKILRGGNTNEKEIKTSILPRNERLNNVFNFSRNIRLDWIKYHFRIFEIKKRRKKKWEKL